MRVDRSLVAAAWALALAGMLQPAQSAPIGNAVGQPRTALAGTSGPEQIASRVCTTDGGVRRCRRVGIYGPGPGVYGYQAPAPAPGVVLLSPPIFYIYRNGYRSTDPYDYPTGSNPWWHGMDRWDQGGQTSGR
jgi:hypothetical protein